MSIYNIDGDSLNSAFSSESQLSVAYDINGNQVWSAEPPVPSNLKVMSYNVGGWYIGSGTNVPSYLDATYYALQNRMLADNDPDILCLQEYWTNFSPTRTAVSMLQQYFPYIHEQNGNSTYFGRCICSKYPITNYTTHTFASDPNRYYDSCTITIGGEEITVITTHFATNRVDRTLQIAELLDYVSTLDKFIAGGDFNTYHCLDSSGADYIGVIQPKLSAGYNIANCYGNQSTFKVTYSELPDNDTNNRMLDNIITSSDLAITSASVDTTKLTDGINERVDHMPLFAGLTL